MWQAATKLLGSDPLGRSRERSVVSHPLRRQEDYQVVDSAG